MREDFLHYLWKYKKFDTTDLYTTNHEPITIINAGIYHQLAGPDFFNAQLIIGNQKWAGNIEIHLKSSDWYAHHHEIDQAYENVIMHVVWNHDTEIYRRDNTEIPVLELRHFVDSVTIENFCNLTAVKSWIYCERQLEGLDPFILENWLERMYFERLQKKSESVTMMLHQHSNDWEAVLFCLLARNFGLNTNGDSFLKLAKQIPFAVVRKESVKGDSLEALLFGYANLLNDERQDNYWWHLRSLFTTLRQKYSLNEPEPLSVQFFKHRPDNFPTIRLAQFAMLYATEQNLFSKVLAAKSTADIYSLFNVSVSKYWQTHFQFDRESPFKGKGLSKSFIDLLIVNTLVPVRFSFGQSRGLDTTEELTALLREIQPESNHIVEKYNSVKIQARNAMESQGLLQLKADYCDRGRCLECAIGIELLRQPSITFTENVKDKTIKSIKDF